MASTKLAEAVGYPGSSVAFAQLLSGMERDGLIAREVRGKRTYRIILAPGVQPGRGRIPGPMVGGLADASLTAASPLATASLGAPGGVVAGILGGVSDAVPAMIGGPGPNAGRFDYDELARRLLVQVIRRLATPPDGQDGVVADLERELAAARSRASTLSAENRELREQLSQVRRTLDEASRSLDGPLVPAAGEPAPGPSGPVGEELSDAEIVLLERLIAPARDAMLHDGIQQDATAS
ncbi:MAG TPA: hypothetical protein VH478_10235 [Trebonia sp.]|jgi:hypothetical protein|nr:hypothetical protein [Trebonia sp.]